MEILDLTVGCIEDCFNQPEFEIYRLLETLLMKSCKQDDLAADLDIVCNFYEDDFEREWFRNQFKLGVHYQQVRTDGSITIIDINLLSLSFCQLTCLSKVKCLSDAS